MFGNFFNKSSSEPVYVLTISIRRTLLSLGIVDISKEPAKFLYVTKEPVVNGDLKSLDTALKRLISEGFVKISTNDKPIKIKKVKVVLNASFYDVYIKDLIIEKDKPFVLTKDQFQKALEKHAEIISAEKEGKLILERDVTNVMINGYSMENPFEKPATKISVSFYASFVEKDLIENIKDIIQTNIRISKIEFSTFALNKFNAIRNVFLNTNNYLSVDVGEKYTDILIVENRSLRSRDAFEIGFKDIIDEVTQKCSLNSPVAISALKLAASGDISDQCNQDVLNILKEKQQKWVNSIATELSDNKGINIPTKVFLCSEDKISDVFYKTLLDPNMRKNLFSTEKEITVFNLNNQYFKKHVIYGDNVETDIFLTLIAINLDL